MASQKAMACGPTMSISSLTTRPMPMKPTPMVSPARKLRASPWRSASPKTIMMNGIITAAPRSST